jgi:hypothetical protein
MDICFARCKCSCALPLRLRKEFQPASLAVLKIEYVFEVSEWLCVTDVVWIYHSCPSYVPQGTRVLTVKMLQICWRRLRYLKRAGLRPPVLLIKAVCRWRCVWSIVGMMLKAKNLRKKSRPSGTSSATNLTFSGPGSNQDLRGETGICQSNRRLLQSSDLLAEFRLYIFGCSR